jgi:hypothetical protein
MLAWPGRAGKAAQKKEAPKERSKYRTLLRSLLLLNETRPFRAGLTSFAPLERRTYRLGNSGGWSSETGAGAELLAVVPETGRTGVGAGAGAGR